VAEIKHLLETVKVDEEDVAKILHKASCEDWSELNETQAMATIAWLNKKLGK
jgi:SOS response regulatory protein OraA/RecX